MRRLTALAFLAYAVASLLVFCFGDSGLTAWGRLDAFRARLEANVRELEDLNRSLQAELASLRDDPRRTEVLARELGLYRGDDRVLRIEGAGTAPRPYEVGALLRLRRDRFERGPWLKTAGLAAALLAGALAFLLGRRGRRTAHGPRRR
jgi:hypothetical protein